MRRRSSLSEKFSWFANGFMVFVYGAIGFFFIFGNTTFFQGTMGKYFGATLILYAAYRGFSLFKRYKNTVDEN